MNMSRFTLALLMAIGCALLGPGTLALPGAIPAAAAQPPTGEESHAEDSHSEAAIMTRPHMEQRPTARVRADHTEIRTRYPWIRIWRFLR